jgi:phosphate-selective porin OprO/OprP
MLPTSSGGKVVILTLAVLLRFSGPGWSQDVPADPPAPQDGAAPTTSADELAERFRKLEEANRKLFEQVEKIDKRNQTLIEQNQNLSKENKELSKEFQNLREKMKSLEKGPKPGTGGAESSVPGRRPGDGETGGGSTPGGGPRSGGPQTADEGQDLNKPKRADLKLKGRYNYDNEGFQFTTENDEFEIKFRTVLQAEGQLYQQANQTPTHSGLYLPRSRFYATGHMTKPIEYYFSIQRGYNNLDILDSFINFHYDDRLQFKFGRYRTPFTYEFYQIPAWKLLAPERSVFNVNFQGGRQVGAMAWGQLADDRLEYAVGAFDGSRGSFTNYNNEVNVMALLNAKPFLGRGGSPLQHLNFGGSVDYGQTNDKLTPATLRTSANPNDNHITADSTINNASVAFLDFNPNVRERGLRSLWELHTAYYYKRLAILAAWDAGYSNYKLDGRGAQPQKVPINGYFVQAAFNLTGETATGPTVLDPIRPFDLRPDHFGLGAWQATTRYSALSLGDEVFTGGFADPNLWTNGVQMVDVGMNWYLNKFTKIYFDWEHAVFAQPVQYRPGALQKTSDLFWIRVQVAL